MFYYKNLKISCPENVYPPMEDSILMATVLNSQNLTEKDVLEIGCGSGFLSILAAKSNSRVTAVDKNPLAIETTLKNAKRNGVKVKAYVSDIFNKVKGKFDIIFFNPPYLPDEKKYSDEMWSDRGEIEIFVKNVKKYLKRDGVVFLLLSTLTKTDAAKMLKHEEFYVKTVAKRKLPWEEIYVLMARPKHPTSE